MQKICLILQYDGTEFSGWQLQPNARTVQAVVEEGLAHLLGCNVRLHSSGRTDAGVHARGMVTHFHSPVDLPLPAYREGLNRLLPPDVSVLGAQVVAEDFHARFSAVGKWYRYSILRSPVRQPLYDRYAWQIKAGLDLETMRAAAELFVGRHDFAAFRSSTCDAVTTVREIFSLHIVEDGLLVQIDVRGSGFLKNMVRVIVGTLVEIGCGKRSVADVGALLHGGDRTLAGKTAPGKGLCLMQVDY